MRFLRWFGLARDPRPKVPRRGWIDMLRAVVFGVAIVTSIAVDAPLWIELPLVLVIGGTVLGALAALERRLHTGGE